VRALGGAVARLATLPAARARLDRLAAAPSVVIQPARPMSYEEAARPTPQTE